MDRSLERRLALARWDLSSAYPLRSEGVARALNEFYLKDVAGADLEKEAILVPGRSQLRLTGVHAAGSGHVHTDHAYEDLLIMPSEQKGLFGIELGHSYFMDASGACWRDLEQLSSFRVTRYPGTLSSTVIEAHEPADAKYSSAGFKIHGEDERLRLELSLRLGAQTPPAYLLTHRLAEEPSPGLQRRNPFGRLCDYILRRGGA